MSAGSEGLTPDLTPIAVRRRRTRNSRVEELDQERALDLVTAEAQRQINLQFGNSDARDFKTFGWVAAVLASVALTMSLQRQWSWAWLLPIVCLVIAMLAFIGSLWDEEFERGPDLSVFYSEAAGSVRDAKRRLLSDLFGSLRHNEGRLERKRQWYQAGCWGLFATAWTSAFSVTWLLTR